MANLKCDVRSLPQLVERNGRLWFKLKLDAKMQWQPDDWREPLDDMIVDSVLKDTSLTTHSERVSRLQELSGLGYSACTIALHSKRWHDNSYLSISDVDFQRQVNEPVRCGTTFWFYRNRLVKVHGEGVTDELPLLIKHKVLSHEKSLDRVRHEVEAFETFERISRTVREPIPEKVRMFVWQRDGGRCVKCGSQHRLEYDHIIPLSNGGSNTERNIQLLCESCNRSKGSQII